MSSRMLVPAKVFDVYGISYFHVQFLWIMNLMREESKRKENISIDNGSGGSKLLHLAGRP